MSNTELTKYYMGLQLNTNKMPEVAYANIIPALDKHFNGQWTWELADERFAQDNTTVCTTVTVYTPGRVYTGRSLCKIKDYASNHLFAILDACQTFIEKNLAQPQSQPQTNPGSQQMTPDQIMNALGQQPQQQQVNTAAQFYNYKDAQGMPASEVPFDAITDNCHKELQQEMGMAPKDEPNQVPFDTGNPGGMVYHNVQPQQQSAPTPQQGGIDPDAPQDRYKGFSQRQIDRLNKFKADFDIMNDEMFGNYVNTWDKSLTSKKDITPANANAFLSWVENLGKMGC